MNNPLTAAKPPRTSKTEYKVPRNHEKPPIQGRTFNFALLVAVHIFFGGVVYLFPSVSTFHVYAVVTVGIICAFSRLPVYSAYAAAYVVGAEVLWRMTDARFFWEGGKYAVVLILGLSLFHQRIKLIPVASLTYFLLLLPSVVLTIGARGSSSARDLISFNLSGPFALFVSVWFFSSLNLTRVQLKNLMLLMAFPICTTAVYALLSTLSLSEIRWANDSMFETSGGFGPNQVSTIMGFGVIIVWVLLLLGVKGKLARVLLAIVGVSCFIQGALTFSRGGIVAAVIVISFITVHAIRSAQERTRLILLLLLVVPVVSFVVLPTLNDFTQGFLEARFTDTDLTNRDVIIEDELQAFLENPVVGIGPGMGRIARGVAAHTEMTRLLAEHGLLGAASMFLLVVMAVRKYFETARIVMRGINGGLLLWALIIMTNAAMRLVAVSFVFGLAFAKIDFEEHEY